MGSANWDITPAEAKGIQQELRSQVQLTPLSDSVELVAGADMSFNLGEDVCYAAIVVLNLATLEVVDTGLAKSPLTFPYVPGYLSFRELPPLVDAWDKLSTKPDVVILDGHGIAHPRRFGIASHFGVHLDVPTIGCGKNILVGKAGELDTKKGSWSWMEDKGEQVCIAYRSRDNVKPIYLSPGHKCDFESSVRIIEKCLTKYRLPVTARLAHNLCNSFRKGEVQA